MAFASGSGGGPMADINVTPLVDVMLVLLIIFMVTAPILSYPIDVNLPQRTLNPPPNPKDPAAADRSAHRRQRHDLLERFADRYSRA
jgi:biopolymer transport protein ExbD